MIELFSYTFMQHAFIAGLLIAVMAAVMGAFIVLRRYAMISDTLAHVALVGVAVGIVSGQNPLWSAVIVSLVAAWSMEYLRYVKKLYSDSIMALFLSGSLAIAVIIVSLAGAFNSSLFSYLFGNILAVTQEDITTIAVFSIIVFLFIFRYFDELVFVAFDEEVAKVSGIPVGWINFLQISIVAIVVALSIRVVGTLLIGALMIIPAMSAMQFKVGFFKTIVLAILYSCVSVFFGLLVSYYMALPSGAAIVVTALILFALTMGVRRN